MYPLSCIDIRNFLNQFYFFADNHFRHPHVIDETLKKANNLFPKLLNRTDSASPWAISSANKSARFWSSD